MAGLTKEQLSGKAAYLDANKDVSDAIEWKDLDEEQRNSWINTAIANDLLVAPVAPAEPEPPSDLEPVPGAATWTETPDAIPVYDVPAPIEKCLTIRELAEVEYRKELGPDAAAFDTLEYSEIEQWEATARLKNRPA